MKGTKIEWAHHTFNPWHGCEKVSPACRGCYAEAFSKRIGLDIWGADKPRRFFGDKHWAQPLKWNRDAAESGEQVRVFCASMADVFEDRKDLDEHRARLFALIEDTPHLTWLLLTKRPGNIRLLAPWRVAPDNVWLGTTVETPEYGDRIYALNETPAPVHFVSYEPALEQVHWIEWLGRFAIQRCIAHHHRTNHDCGGGGTGADCECGLYWEDGRRPLVEWMIVGGESGPKRRTLDLEWLAEAAADCKAFGVPIFVKQDSGPRPGQQGRIPDDVWALKQVPEVRRA